MIETDNEVIVREPPIQVAGRFLGIVVFLIGIFMLGAIFLLAYRAFHNPDLLIPMKLLNTKEPVNPAYVYVPTVLKLILLFVMGYLGSLIAGRGAHMFFSAKREARRAAAGD